MSLVALSLRRWRQHKARTLLSVLGIAVGATLVVAVVALTGSLDASIAHATSDLVRGSDLSVRATNEGGLPVAVADQVRATPGVAAVQPIVRTTVQVGAEHALLLGADAPPKGSPTGASATAGLPAAEVRRITELQAAARTTGLPAVVVGEGLARAAGLREGGPVTVVVGGAAHQAVVSAIAHGDAVQRVNRGSLLVTDLGVAQALTGRPGVVDQVLVRRAPATSTKALQATLRAALAGRAEVASPKAEADQLRKGLASITQGMLLGSSLALAVGGFLVYTTMSMAALERRRELATLRAVGGRRRTILAGFMGEAAALGVAGSAVGIVVGVLISRQLVGALPSFLLSALGVQVTPTLPLAAIPLGLAAGLGATLLAAYPPARKAVTVAPVEAMRPEGTLEGGDGSGIAWGPVAAGVLALALGTTLMVVADGQAAMGGFFIVSFGPPLVTYGLTGPLARAAAAVANRLGRAGRLAGAAIERAPRRAWSTSAAVMMAVGIVAGQGSIVHGVTQAITGNVDDIGRTDVYVDAEAGGALTGTALLPATWPAEVAALPGVAQAAGSRYAYTTVGDDRILLQGVGDGVDDPSLTTVRPDARPDLLAGSGVVLSTGYAARLHLKRGGSYTLPSATGPRTLPVLDVIPSFKSPIGVVIGSLGLVDQVTGRPGVSAIYVHLRRGVPRTEGLATVQAFAGRWPTKVTVEPGAALIKTIRAGADQSQAAFVGMQWVIVVASFLAVLNAFLISVVERRRELGILRAIGTGRRVLGRMVVGEAAAVGFVGAVVGLVFGYLISRLGVRALGSATGLPLTYEFVALPFVRAVLVAAGVCLVGAALPARRAGRVDVLGAIGYE